MNLICPKCSGVDYFMSQRNVVKGMGWAQRGSIKSTPVCRVCDEIMVSPQMALTREERIKFKNAELKSIRLWKQVAYIVLAFLIILIPFIFYLS